MIRPRHWNICRRILCMYMSVKDIKMISVTLSTHVVYDAHTCIHVSLLKYMYAYTIEHQLSDPHWSAVSQKPFR